MNRIRQTIEIAEPLWRALEAMSRDLGVERDALVAQALFQLARQNGYVAPTVVPLATQADGAQASVKVGPPAGVVSPPSAEASSAPAPTLADTSESNTIIVAGAQAASARPMTVVTVSPASAASTQTAPEVTPAEATAKAESDAAESTESVDVMVARMQEVLAEVDAKVEPLADVSADDDEDAEEDAEDSVDEDSEDEDSGEEDSDEATSADEEAAAGDSDEEAEDERAAEEPSTGENEMEDEIPHDGRTIMAAPAPRLTPKARPDEATAIVQAPPTLEVFVRYAQGEPVAVTVDRFTIGRGPQCSLVVKSERVSREHAVVLREGGDVFIEDLNSSNGVWFKQQRIKRQKVQDGDMFRLGSEAVYFTVRTRAR